MLNTHAHTRSIQSLCNAESTKIPKTDATIPSEGPGNNLPTNVLIVSTRFQMRPSVLGTASFHFELIIVGSRQMIMWDEECLGNAGSDGGKILRVITLPFKWNE